MPVDGVPSVGHGKIMRYEEIMFLCGVLSDLGVRKFRFTGGEPLVRKGFSSFLLEFRKNFPTAILSLTTNASLLSKYATELAESGLSSMNVSLDTLVPEKFRHITRVGNVEDVLGGIRAAKRAGIANIKTNTVLIKEFNDKELPDILSLAWGEGLIPRFIEFMPLHDDIWIKEKFISAGDILKGLAGCCGALKPVEKKTMSCLTPLGPAKYYTNFHGGVVGVIEAVSNHFCSTCNRLRITSSGSMRACLFSKSETPLMEALKDGDRKRTMDAILSGMRAKPERWEVERDRSHNMSDIGG
jgi:cyclic pyranopterin phosphate synthase